MTDHASLGRRHVTDHASLGRRIRVERTAKGAGNAEVKGWREREWMSWERVGERMDGLGKGGRENRWLGK